MGTKADFNTDLDDEDLDYAGSYDQDEDGLEDHEDSDDSREDEGSDESGGPAEDSDETTDEDSGGSGDERNSSRTEEEREELRAQRRLRRAQKKRDARQREEQLQRQLGARDRLIEDLTNRLNTIERRTGNTDLAQVDNALSQLRQAHAQVQAQMKEAAESGNGDAMVNATETLYQIRRRGEELTNLRATLVRGQQPPTPPLDPRLVVNAQNWMDRNRWYKPEGTDRDSRIVRRLDSELEEEGWKPTDPAYWRELTIRVKKELPHRFNPVYNDKSKNSSPPRKQIVGKSGSSVDRGHRRDHISAERVEALKQAGLWDNPKTREAAIKEFQEHDRRQKAG